MLLLGTGSLYLLRGLHTTAVLSETLIRVIHRLAGCMAMFAIFWLILSSSFLALEGSVVVTRRRAIVLFRSHSYSLNPSPPARRYESVGMGRALFLTFQLMIIAPEISDEYDIDNSQFGLFLHVIFTLIVLVIVIILLNLTIPVVNEVWDEISETRELLIVRNRAELIVELMTQLSSQERKAFENRTAFLHVLELVERRELRTSTEPSLEDRLEDRLSILFDAREGEWQKETHSHVDKIAQLLKDHDGGGGGSGTRLNDQVAKLDASITTLTQQRLRDERVKQIVGAMRSVSPKPSKRRFPDSEEALPSPTLTGQRAPFEHLGHVETLSAQMKTLETRHEQRMDQVDTYMQSVDEHLQKVASQHDAQLSKVLNALNNIPTQISDVLRKEQKVQVEKVEKSWKTVESRFVTEARRLQATEERLMVVLADTEASPHKPSPTPPTDDGGSERERSTPLPHKKIALPAPTNTPGDEGAVMSARIPTEDSRLPNPQTQAPFAVAADDKAAAPRGGPPSSAAPINHGPCGSSSTMPTPSSSTPNTGVDAAATTLPNNWEMHHTNAGRK